jgi:hypothetical protein
MPARCRRSACLTLTDLQTRDVRLACPFVLVLSLLSQPGYLLLQLRFADGAHPTAGQWRCHYLGVSLRRGLSQNVSLTAPVSLPGWH